MRVRFLETTASAVAGYPFQAGQVIEVPRLTADLRAALKAGKAELVPEETSEAAVLGGPRPRGSR